MAQQLVDQRDMEFVIWEQFNNEEILNNDQFAAFNKSVNDFSDGWFSWFGHL